MSSCRCSAEQDTRSPPTTVADLLLHTLAEAGVDYIFAVLGSDHPSIIEAYLKRQQAGQARPRLLPFQHEFVAISAADGYGRVTGRPQCVLVHVDVGTAALGQGLHNASVGRVPMLIVAGLAPCTVDGGVLGARSEAVHWMQDVANQASIVAPYVRHHNEIKRPEHVRGVVRRALWMATSGASPGPTYLTATRELLATPVAGDAAGAAMVLPPPCRVGGLPPAAVESIGEALMSATSPLIVTGYLGRNPDAVRKLVDLTDRVPGVAVFDAENRYMSFPASHPAWLTRSTGAAAAIRHADLILVVDCDVPWIPAQVRPATTSRIFHLDIDARKDHMQLFDIGAEATFLADAALALDQLIAFVLRHHQPSAPPPPPPPHRETRSVREDAHAARLDALAARTRPSATGAIGIDGLAHVLRRTLPRNTTYVHDAVTNTTPLLEQLQLHAPGTCLGKGGSGLGWAGGASIGVALAAAPRPASDALVCCVTGDGAFVLGVPPAVYWAQKRLRTPFLTVLLNNGGWKATRVAIRDLHPTGLAAASSDADLGIDLARDAPDYVGLAVAASNGDLWGVRVVRAADLEHAVRHAVRVVQHDRRGALVEVVIS